MHKIVFIYVDFNIEDCNSVILMQVYRFSLS